MKGRDWKDFFFIAATGTLLHFLYDFLPSPVTAVISGVNESVWEHMKLLFVPAFLRVMLGGREIAAGAAGIFAALGVIPAGYYTYTGALGRRILAVDMGIFYLATAVCVALARHLEGRMEKKWQRAAAWIALMLTAFLFILWTFYPPRIPLFQDPLSGGYGLGGNI